MTVLKLSSSRSEFNRRLRATCTKTAAHTWHAEAIWTLLLFWPTVARSGRLDADLDERSYSELRIFDQRTIKANNNYPFKFGSFSES